MKYRIYFDAEEVINGIRDFDTVKELLDFIADESYGMIAAGIGFHNISHVYEKDFRIHYISEIEEKVISLDEPIRVAMEIGRKNLEEGARKLDEECRKFIELQERVKFEELKKKFEGS